ncbi:SDR family NAD(P)-dependent oxidoreductase [Jidongwangia harbinensis]|uniref:SDR family NAD(P)-dependent oxidoreductase n=1 Tax=Jidongwangia harbinensis TaxID=2878561 RepID=UPI001CD92100|nr:SDR family oxidoreductase [Jidongwangia harbinensis]MCA2215512.1 SDR family oxidoreductase [Jidongwangia harbinensis]
MTHRQNTADAATALVTGASAGLGAEFAVQLAERGHHLVLVARSADRLRRHAEHLRTTYGVRVDVIAQDLGARGAPDRILTELVAAGITVDVLVNSAGFGTAGRFEEIDDGLDTEQLMVNVVALVGLTRALVPDMLARGHGSVVNVASTAGFQPSPYFAAYGAGKTFVLNFSLALRSEYRGRGVRVLALCPGPTRTSFFDTMGERAAIGGAMMPAEAVVRAALAALDRDRAYVVPGLGNSLGAHLTPRRPRRLVTAISKLVTRSVLEGPGPAPRDQSRAA